MSRRRISIALLVLMTFAHLAPVQAAVKACTMPPAAASDDCASQCAVNASEIPAETVSAKTCCRFSEPRAVEPAAMLADAGTRVVDPGKTTGKMACTVAALRITQPIRAVPNLEITANPRQASTRTTVLLL